MVVAVVALVVAMGGTGYAAATLPRNSVGTKQLKSGAVTASKVRNFSLSTVDFNRDTVASLRGSTGPQGPAGPTGREGERGATGPAGSALAYMRWLNGAFILADAKGIVAADVTNPVTGVYCVAGLASIPHNVVATVDAAGTGASGTVQATVQAAGGCPPATQITVLGFSTTGMAANTSFFLSVN